MTDPSEEVPVQEPQSITFRTLDEQEGFYLTAPLSREWPLEKWFASLYDVPLHQFTDFDLARSLRQGIHVEAVVPYSLRALERNPLAGELYDGELLTAMIHLPQDYWLVHVQERDALTRIVQHALLTSDDEDLTEEIQRWVTALSAQPSEH
jgi:hypothetical protein